MKNRAVLLLAVPAFLAGALFLARWNAEPILSDVGFSQVVLGSRNEVLRITLSGEEKYRVRTRVEDVSPHFLEALFLLEDRHFHAHPGLNPFSLIRAALSTYRGGPRMGGSTLTMQVARLKYGLYTKDLRGKLRQILFALKLELLHSKKEILEAYLNLAPYGANLEGIGSASFIYFNKQPKDLSLSPRVSCWRSFRRIRPCAVLALSRPAIPIYGFKRSGRNLIRAKN